MSCSVQGFHQSFEPIPEIPVATVVTAWDEEPVTGQTYILVIHQVLYFGVQLDHSFIYTFSEFGKILSKGPPSTEIA
jgi:hypothetical protein